jgi:N-acetyl-gamma-glutamyl-phosphate reductase
VHPHLAAAGDLVLEPTTAASLRGHDVVFLALPHGASAALAVSLPEDVVVVDCGADYRLSDAEAWHAFYGSQHAGTWPYGLPELPIRGGSVRDELKGAIRIAVPGCYPTACSLALAPGFAAGLLEPNDVVIVAASGTSGAGKGLKPHLLGSEVMGSMSPYGVGGGHRHTPEIRQNLALAAGEPVTLSFTPTLAPMARGILATCTARVTAGTTAEGLRAAWEDAYGGEPFVHLLPQGQWPRTADVLGANVAQVQLTLDESVGRAVVVAALDNLTKGTAGGAIQCANLALGLPETAGLPVAGVAP